MSQRSRGVDGVAERTVRELRIPESAGEVASVWSHLGAGGAALLRGGRDGCASLEGLNALIEGLIEAAWRVSGRRLTSSSRNRIEHLRPKEDPLVYSTTSRAMPLHTDEANELRPAAFVLLHCVRAATVSGESLVAHSSLALERVPTDLRGALLRPDYPFGCGRMAIVTGEVMDPRVRFNAPDILHHALSPGNDLSDIGRASVRAFESALARVARLLVLRPGDCLVLDNTRFLHGRRAYPPEDPRLLERVRLAEFTTWTDDSSATSRT